jgi:ERCC4-type nuclease
MWIDYRERDLLQRNPEAVSKPLPIADIWVGTFQEEILQPGGVLIERKTVADLEASILDGRYREQRARLLSHAQEHRLRVAYIIEGSLDRIVGRFAETTLQQFLNRLQLRYGIAVFHTDSVQQTSDLCQLLEFQLGKDPKCFLADTAADYTATIHVQKKANQTDPKYFFYATVQQCPGVSQNIAQKIHEKYGSLKSLMEATEDDLAQTPIGARKLGSKVAERLLQCLNGTA